MNASDDIHDSDLSGKRIGSYLLEEEVGRGGMGAVYRAKRIDGEFDQTVAIKLIKRGMDTDAILRRFRRERQILASLDHPNIAYFLGGGSTEMGLPYFVMEFISGSSLYIHCDKNKLDVRQRLLIFRQICWAVSAAHSANVIHRDLKPNNILVNQINIPKLLDFGIGKLLEDDDQTVITDSTAIHSRIMTPEYASPEQISGKPLDFGTDIYSLGVILYELLTGHRPYIVRKNDRDDALKVIREQLPPNPSSVITEKTGIIHLAENSDSVDEIFNSRNTSVGELARQLSGDLDRIVQKALRKDPASRYRSVKEFFDDITNYLDGKPVSAEYSSTLGEISFNARSSKLKLAILPLRVLKTNDQTDTGDFVGVGFSDALISRLSSFNQILVRPTTSILKFTDGDPFEAGKELDVDYVVDGNVRIYQGRIRVSVQLLDISLESTRWARAFDKDTGDVLELEDSLAEQIARTLIPHLSSEDQLRLKRRRTDKPEAYEAYLRGRYFWSRFNDVDLKKAINEFEEAIRLDPNYSLPYIGLADFYIWSAIFGEMPSIDAFEKAESAIKKALEIDDKLAEAYAALAFIRLLFHWDWNDAEYLSKKAIELNPNYAFGHECRATFLCAQGRFDEAVEEIKTAEYLEHYSPRSLLMTSWILYQARRYPEAVASARRAFQTHPDLPQTLLHLGNCLTLNGDLDEAVTVLRRSSELWGNGGMPRQMLATARSAQGNFEAVNRILEKMLERAEHTYLKPYYIAMCYLAAQNIDSAFEWFKRSLDERNEWMIWFGVDPKLDPLRNDPRYWELLTATRNPLADRDRNHITLEPITGDNKRSIAVMPFRFLGSSDNFVNHDHLALGLADAVTMRLSNVRRFLVRPTSSVVKFTQTGSDPFLIGNNLGVDFVVDGIIRQINEKIAVTAQLLDVKEGSVRWSMTFNESCSDILELEDKISGQVARSLIPKLSVDDISQLRRRGTRSSSAYESFLQGRYYWSQFTSDSFANALERYEKAISIDPQFAEAYTGMAELYAWASIYGLSTPAENISKIKAAASQALEINPDLSEAHSVMGLYHSFMQSWKESEDAYRTALELNPNNPLAHEWLSAILVGSGRTAEGVSAIETAEDLDPISLRPKVLSAWTLYQAHEFERAYKKSQQLLTLNGEYMQSHLQMANVLQELGDQEMALHHAETAFQMEPDSPMPLYTYCFALAANNRAEEALKHTIKWENLRSVTYVPAYFIALSYLALRDHQKALLYLDLAREEQTAWTIWYCSEPKLKPLRGHPLFKDMLKKMNGPILPDIT